MLLRASALAMVLYRMYRRLPAGQRRQLRNLAAVHGLRLARRHGPHVVGAVRRSRRPRL